MKTAMILCAGFGTRLKDITKDTPKPMLELAGKPLLEHTICHLSSLGIKNIVINVHYLADKITSYFNDGGKWGLSIQYSHESEPLGTAGAVKKVEDILKNSNEFLVLYGDVICNEDYNSLLAFQRSKINSVASIILHERERSNSIVELDPENRITRFIERPIEKISDKKQKWVNSGLYCFSNKIFEFIPEKVYCDFPKDVFPALVSKRLIYGYPLTGYRCAIDSVERYKEAKEGLKERMIFK